MVDTVGGPRCTDVCAVHVVQALTDRLHGWSVVWSPRLATLSSLMMISSLLVCAGGGGVEG